jgi:hypothetical protein
MSFTSAASSCAGFGATTGCSMSRRGSQVRQGKPTSVDANGKPRKIDSCYAYASDREVVHRLWPMYYDGPAAPPAREGQAT